MNLLNRKAKPKPEPMFIGLQTKTLSADAVAMKMTSQLYEKLEEIKEKLGADYYVLPRETTYDTVRIPRGVPFTVSYFGKGFGQKCFLFENSKYENRTDLLKEVFIDRTEEEPEIREVPKTEAEQKNMEDIAKEWWSSIEPLLSEEIRQTGGYVDINLGKGWGIPDPEILPYVRKYLSDLTKGAFFFDSIDDDCNGLIVSHVDDNLPEEPEEQETEVVAESRAEKFAKRQAKAIA